jgi:hypothetical protein
VADSKRGPEAVTSDPLPPAGGSPDGVASAESNYDDESVKEIQNFLDSPKPSMPAGAFMTMPAGAFMTDDHRYYFNGEGPKPSVTTILEMLDKPALSTWKAQQAVKALYQNLRAHPNQLWTENEAVKWALAEVRKTRTNAASIGSGVHHLADMALRAPENDPKAWQVSEDTQPYIDAYRAFSDRYERSSFVSSEKMVWSLNGYAGTYDLLMMIDNELWLIDIKTGKGLYPEFALQLAAYRWADWIILPGNPQHYEMPNIERTGILHIRPELYPEGYSLIDIPITYKDDYIPFLGILEAYNWKERRKKLKQ